MNTPEPLWTDEDMVNEMKAGLTLLTISRPVKIGDFVNRAMAWAKRMCNTYEAERAAHLARIAELEAQEWEWEPVPAGRYTDAWEILPDGGFSVRDHEGHWVVADWPDGWRLMRRKAGAGEVQP
jgi:hypothetical protein